MAVLWSFSRDLIERALEGNADARKMLWAEFRDCAWTMARALGRRRNIHDEDFLEEVVQNVIVNICSLEEEEFECVENWAGWIFKATSSRITDRLRLVIRERTRKTSLDAKTDDDVSLLDVLACMGANTASLDCRTLLDEIRRFLDTLPKATADVFRLYMQEKSQKEIADALQIPKTTVNMNIYHVKQAIRSRFARFASELWRNEA
ncbi:MAG: sigma-70 family RNA polymerase sigma factor [Candidatus Hydrogenedentes bacterium]|nr:sigma-70 family RNA polymerase sigma factor [Candidatus Hydrogenedentota bacterium]